MPLQPHVHVDEVFVGCAFGKRARRCRAEGLFASIVVPEASRQVVLFPERPSDRQWGPVSRHVFRSSFYHLKPLFAVTSGPPAPPASATTSTEGRDRSIGCPLTAKATPMHSPALADLLGRLPRSAPEKPSRSQPPTSCRGLQAACHPWGQEGTTGGGHRLPTLPRPMKRPIACRLRSSPLPLPARSPHQPIAAAGSPRHPLNGDSGLPPNPPIARFGPCAKAPCNRDSRPPAAQLDSDGRDRAGGSGGGPASMGARRTAPDARRTTSDAGTPEGNR